MSTPAGLTRYSRVIPTKREGQCEFCQVATRAPADFAAVNGGSGKWIAVCATCATSLTEQVKGVVRSIEAIAAGITVADDALAGVDMHVLADVTLGIASEAQAYETLRTLLAARTGIAQSADPVIAGLRTIAADATASARNREFATSLVEWFDTRGSITPNQRTAAERMLARGTNAAPAAPITAGLYVVGPDGEWSSFWLVRKARQGEHVYAMRLMSEPREGEKLDWSFVKGGMSTVRRGRAATAAEAAGLGWATHHCCFCGIELTDEGEGRSVEVGYGPVCANNNGLPWG